MEEDYVMIPGSGTKKIIRDVKKERCIRNINGSIGLIRPMT